MTLDIRHGADELWRTDNPQSPFLFRSAQSVKSPDHPRHPVAASVEIFHWYAQHLGQFRGGCRVWDVYAPFVAVDARACHKGIKLSANAEGLLREAGFKACIPKALAEDG